MSFTRRINVKFSDRLLHINNTQATKVEKIAYRMVQRQEIPQIRLWVGGFQSLYKHRFFKKKPIPKVRTFFMNGKNLAAENWF